MPLLDLLVLCLLPDFRPVLSRFSGQIKVDLRSTPAQLFLRPIVTPFILDTRSPTPVLKRLQKSLRTLTATPPD